MERGGEGGGFCGNGEGKAGERGERKGAKYRVMEDGRGGIVRVGLVGRFGLVEGEDFVDDLLLLRGGGAAGEGLGVVVEAGGRHGG